MGREESGFSEREGSNCVVSEVMYPLVLGVQCKPSPLPAFHKTALLHQVPIVGDIIRREIWRLEFQC